MTQESSTKASLHKTMNDLENSSEEFVPIEQVRELVRGVKDLFEGNFKGEDIKLYGELGDLAHFINGARKDLREFRPNELADKELPDASDQLDAIVAQTENATSKIMDACEQIENQQTRVKDRLLSHEPALDIDIMAGVDDATAEVQKYIADIYESCNFQDLTGQRIMKIVNTLQEIERQVLRMVVVFGLTNKSDELDDDTIKALEDDATLLNGPQLPGQSLEQDDIDDILDKLL